MVICRLEGGHTQELECVYMCEVHVPCRHALHSQMQRSICNGSTLMHSHIHMLLQWVWQVNVVVMRGINDDEVGDFVELTRHAPINVRFIEYMPFDGNVWSRDKLVPYRELMAALAVRFPQGLDRCQVSSAPPCKATVIAMRTVNGNFTLACAVLEQSLQRNIFALYYPI